MFAHGNQAHEKRILQLKKEKAEAESRAATLREEKERLEQYTKQTLQQVQSKVWCRDVWVWVWVRRMVGCCRLRTR